MSVVDASSVPRSVADESSAVARVAAWFTVADHARLGRLYLSLTGLWLLVAAVLGALLGLERMDSGSALVDAGAHVQLFALHQYAVVIGVAAPLFLGVALLVVPSLLGASTVSFVRLAAFGFWLWTAGSALVVAAMLMNGGPGGGDADGVELYLLGLGTAIVGVLCTAVSLAATVIARRNGASLDSVSVFVFSVLVGATGLVLTMPVALGTIIYLWVDFANARVAFGGTGLMASWLAWLFDQPQSLLFVAPALGVLGHLGAVAGRVRQPLRGGVLVGIGLAAVAVVSSVTQRSHVFAVGDTPVDTLGSLVPYALFHLLPLLAPLIVVALALLALKAGSPRLVAPFVPAFLGVGMILTGLVGTAVQMLGATDLAGTVFGEAALMYVVYGGALGAFAALSYWSTAIWRRVLPTGAVIAVSLLGFLATVLSALPHYVAGFLGQPAARAGGFDDAGVRGVLNTIAALGHLAMAAAVLGAVAVVARACARGAETTANPYDAPEVTQ
ncbi:MAG: cbb3-type cytochrome c oxidase subunit I [Ilumatobacteraceae bacterium]|jgi:heme/copper-type cytochrome/quinol oxidase subunit 1